MTSEEIDRLPDTSPELGSLNDFDYLILLEEIFRG